MSGLDDHDYPSLNGASSLTNINQMKIHSKIPLPSEVMEHFGRILSNFLDRVLRDGRLYIPELEIERERECIH